MILAFLSEIFSPEAIVFIGLKWEAEGEIPFQMIHRFALHFKMFSSLQWCCFDQEGNLSCSQMLSRHLKEICQVACVFLVCDAWVLVSVGSEGHTLRTECRVHVLFDPFLGT